MSTPALVGTYVEPTDWNDVLKDPNTSSSTPEMITKLPSVLSRTPPTPNKTFREFPEYVQTLTEKTTDCDVLHWRHTLRESLVTMLGEGFSEVLHLKGGILAYLEQVAPEDSMWQGECFVFDERVTVNHQLEPGSYKQCRRRPANDIDMQSEQYQLGVSCPHCYDETTSSQKERFRERQKQIELARKRQSQ